MRPSLLLLLLACVGSAVAGDADRWQPHQHPALNTRVVRGATRPLRILRLAAEVAAPVLGAELQVGNVVPGSGPALAVRLDDAQAQAGLRLAEAQALQAQRQVAVAAVAVRRAEREEAWRAAEVKRLAEAPERLRREQDEAVWMLDAARLAVDEARAAQAAAQAAAQVATCVVDNLRSGLGRFRLMAPGGWLVTARLTEPGGLALPGETLLELADLGELAVDLSLTEDELAALRSLPEIRLRLAGGATLNARLHHEGMTGDPQTRRSTVVLAVAGADLARLAGGHGCGVTCELPLQVRDAGGCVQVPERFLLRRAGRDLVVDAEGRECAVVVVEREADQALVVADGLPAELVVPTGR